ncbi:MAG: hypothetical protein QXL17_04595 [Candidatus Thermoplasmatota archaeon]
MGKNRDIIQILMLVLLGMFVPFLGSVTVMYGFDLVKIAKTFGLFLVIFAFELGIVYAYFSLTNRSAAKKLEDDKPVL